MARTWQQSGVSVVPILTNATKRPAVRWAEFQVHTPSLGQVDEWWGNGKSYGLALICGAVSGNLEMTEVEGRACTGEALTEIQNRMDELQMGELWDLLLGNRGYSEMSPSGGLHLLYRVLDHEVPGNTKIAQNSGHEVLAETRGEGGYVIVAPTSGLCHPSGEAWTILNGEYGHLPVITWEDRCKLHRALAIALDDTAPPYWTIPTDTPTRVESTDLVPTDGPTHVARTSFKAPEQPATPWPASTNQGVAGLSPGDHFEAVTSWEEILEPHGWRDVGRRGTERLWVRPGKDPREGHSATTGYAEDRDRFYCFSTSTIFPAEQSLTKFAVHTILNFGGNFQLAAADLARQSYGLHDSELDTIHLDGLQKPEPYYSLDDKGNARRLMDRIRGRFHYLSEEKAVLTWNGRKWAPDKTNSLQHEFNLMADEQLEKAQQRGDEVATKFWQRCANMPRVNGCLGQLQSQPGWVITHEELDQDQGLLNLHNGTYNLKTHELAPHDRTRYMTKATSVSYDPTATCPNFEAFMERTVPDPQMRSYVQRALGYSLLGEADQRSLFLICGPSGTGKSTLMTTIEMLFGDYGTTAPSGTLRATGRENSGPSNDLHQLMGKRFVSTSETNEHTAYNEDLIKRLTGRDKIASRRLYQDFVTWSPRCAIWLATNHPPRFNSDDDAIWRRAKVIPFTTVLLGKDQVSDYATIVLAKELNGILNWVLAGLRDYQQNGLQEPGHVQDMAHEVRLQSDPVSRFIEDKIADGVLTMGESNMIRSTELYTMYADWTRVVGERALGSRRFTNRLGSAFPPLELSRVSGNYVWQGIGRATMVTGSWLVGTG